MTVPQQRPTVRLCPRTDLNFTEQYHCSKRRQQQQLVDVHMVDYESTLASTQTHINFVQMLLGEAYRYRLSQISCTRPECSGSALTLQQLTSDPSEQHVVPKLKRKFNRIWASCLHQVTLSAQDGTDPYPDVLQTLSRLHLWSPDRQAVLLT